MIGDADWFVETEKFFGGFVTVKRRAFSKKEGHKIISMMGGDRMGPEHHNYAAVYAQALEPFVARRMDPLTIVELGILRGSGLAMWSVLFPKATIIGLDLEPQNCRKMLSRMHRKGAFQNSEPELYEFDQLTATKENFASIIGQRKIDIMVDDAWHSTEAILRTFTMAYEFLSDDSIYFAEDNTKVADHLRALAPDATVEQFGQLTTVRNKKGPPKRALV